MNKIQSKVLEWRQVLFLALSFLLFVTLITPQLAQAETQDIQIISPSSSFTKETVNFIVVIPKGYNITRISWNFGDRHSASGPDLIEVNHSYSSTGSYAINCTVEATKDNNKTFIFHAIENIEVLQKKDQSEDDSFWDREIPNTPIKIKGLTAFSIVILIMIILLKIIPSRLEKNMEHWIRENEIRSAEKTGALKGLDKGSKKEKRLRISVKKKAEKKANILVKTTVVPVVRFFSWSVFLFFIFMAVSLLGLDINEPIFVNYNITIWSIITFLLYIFFIWLSMKWIVSPVIKLFIHLVSRGSLTSKERQHLQKHLLKPLKFLMVLFGIYLAIKYSFKSGARLPFHDVLITILEVLAILTFSWIIGRIFRQGVSVYFQNKQMERTPKKSLKRFTTFSIMFIGIIISLTRIGVDLYAMATGLGLIGFALAFGMQDTVSNLMAGISLALDRPFSIGDRVKIGDTWGDVADIGLRSTKIKTVEEILVTIPNNMIANSEMWNFTKGDTRLAVKQEIGISYSSDWKLAEKIILEETDKHPRIMSKPYPFVRMTKFEDSCVKLELWCWIKSGQEMYQIKSDLLKKIKDRFDEEGVEIPYPYRTLVKHQDLTPPKRLDPEHNFQEPRKYFGMDSSDFVYDHGNDRLIPLTMKIDGEEISPDFHKGSNILVLVSSLMAAKKKAKPTLSRIKEIQGKAVVAYVDEDESPEKREEGTRALNYYKKQAEKMGIPVSTHLKKGQLSKAIKFLVRSQAIERIIMGESEKTFMSKLMGRDIMEEIRASTDIPIIVIPKDN